MLNKIELAREVEKTASSFSDEELFSNPHFYDLLQSTITAVTYRLGRTPKINGFCDKGSEVTAFTDGDVISINTLGPLIRELPKTYEKYISNFGHVTHECGHVLFTDFKNLNQMREHWNEGEFYFYPEMPRVEGAVELAECFNSNPAYRKIYVSEMNDICNIMEDVYIENRLFEYFDGLCSAGLCLANDELYRLSPDFKDICEHVLSGFITKLSACKGIMQIRCKLGKEPKSEIELSDDEKEIAYQIENVLDDCSDELEALSWENDGLNRCRLFNTLLVKLRPLFQEFDETDEEKQESYMQNSSELSKKTGISAPFKGDSSSVNTGTPDEEKSKVSKANGSMLSKAEKTVSDEIKSVCKSIAKEMCEDANEEEHQKELVEEAENLLNKMSQENKSFRGFAVERKSMEESKDYIGMYKAIYSEIGNVSKTLSKKIFNILKEDQNDLTETGLLIGNHFNALDVFHKDGKYFSKEMEPDEPKDVIFGVLVDESGSMDGAKIERARKISVLLEDVLRRLNVPFALVGHTTTGDDVLLHPYVDFKTTDGMDRYRLCAISAESGNIDSAAITYVAEKLLRRNEERKVLIVISDGLPAGTSFYSNNIDEDMKICISKYRKKGINIFGAILDEYEGVSEIYGNDFSFDCRSYDLLEKQLTKLIRRYCLN